MTLTKTQNKQLSKIDNLMKEDLRKKWLVGLAKAFEMLGYNAIGREIKAGRNVRGNAIYAVGIAHGTFGPHYDLENKKFIPQSKFMKDREQRFMTLVNEGLKQLGEAPINKAELTRKFRAKDKAFEERMRDRK